LKASKHGGTFHYLVKRPAEAIMDGSALHGKPSPTLYQHTRADFVRRGESLARWCKCADVDLSAARKALIGEWTGRKASALVARVVAASDGRG